MEQEQAAENKAPDAQNETSSEMEETYVHAVSLYFSDLYCIIQRVNMQSGFTASEIVKQYKLHEKRYKNANTHLRR